MKKIIAIALTVAAVGAGIFFAVMGITKGNTMDRTKLGVMEIENFGTVKFSFFFDVAPKHVARIQHLIKIGYYDGKTFHRLAPLMPGGKGRILQGGSLQGLGVAGHTDGVTIPLEPFGKHDKGTIGMARTQVRDSANSQFYFNLDDVHPLDGNYTVWGKVESGMDVLEAMWQKHATDRNPAKSLIIKKAYLVDIPGAVEEGK